MSELQIYDVSLEKDHLEKLTKVSPLKGLQEAIWNSLDADASEVLIKAEKNPVGHIVKLVIQDNGHGIDFKKAESEFKGLGESFKKYIKKSPRNRTYHGCEGEGRFRIFALGQYIEIKSVFIDEEDGNKKEIVINLDLADLKRFKIGSIKQVGSSAKTGTRIEISNTSIKINEILTEASISTIEELFTPYYLTYPIFRIVVDGTELEFQRAIKSSYQEYFKIQVDGTEQIINVKIIEWTKNNIEKKICFCDKDGITLEDKLHKMKVGLPLSIYVLSDYFKKLHADGLLIIDTEMNEPFATIVKKAKDIARKYALDVLDYQSTEYIKKLIDDDLYPYRTKASSPVEEIERKIFNVAALQIKELIPTTGQKKDKAKSKLTLSLIKEALESNPTKLSEILKAVLGLSKDEQDNFADLLENTTLTNIINTSKEISDRLIKLDGFKSVILGNLKDKTLERKHLQKLLINETWIFGDDYTLGAADNNLKNVLKKYLTHMERDDFEEIINDVNPSDENYNLIPDICLWKQYKKGYSGDKENLVIEIKKPSIKAGFKELNQIQKYANIVMKDAAFQDGRTQWTFILLTNDIKEDEIGAQINQEGRKPGEAVKGKSHSVFVRRWADILNDADARLSYLKEQLNIEVQENKGVELLNKLYPENVPASV